MEDRDTGGREAGTGDEDAADLSGGEYISHNDRQKTLGYNGVPHRPQRPIREKQLRAVRHGERRRDGDAG